jgi:hypothetical protein
VDRPELAEPDDRLVAEAMTRRVAARWRNESSDTAIGDACLWAQVSAGRMGAAPAGTGDAGVNSTVDWAELGLAWVRVERSLLP